MRRIGVHTSIAGGLHKSIQRAEALGCNTLQIFSHNPRRWEVSKLSVDMIRLFHSTRAAADLSPLYIHTSYLINIASPDTLLRQRSFAMLCAEMERSDAIGAEYVILHTGSARDIAKKNALKRAISLLNKVAEQGKWKTGLLLENTAGQKGDISSKIEDLSFIMHGTKNDLIAGICIDTCHAFAAGYDFRRKTVREKFLENIRVLIGFKKVKCIHLNDSRGPAGSCVDRHAHLGRGCIGRKGLEAFINMEPFRDIPLILETPKKKEGDDPMNLETAQKMTDVH